MSVCHRDQGRQEAPSPPPSTASDRTHLLAPISPKEGSLRRFGVHGVRVVRVSMLSFHIPLADWCGKGG